jgi:mannosyltransferase
MKIIFDNIIFKLQTSGGISNYWYQLLKRIHAVDGLDLSFFDDEQNTKNIFRKELNLTDYKTLGKSPGIVGRYTNPKFSQIKNKTVFHSSYYRYSRNPAHINITTVHDFTYEYFTSGIKLYAHTSQKRKALAQSEGIICVSENTKKDMLHFFPELQSKTVKVIPHGVGANFTVLDYTDKERKKYFNGRPFLLYVGDRRAEYKNFELALKASKESSFPLAIIGGSPLSEKELFFINSQLKTENYIHFHGVSNKKLNEFYNLAHCLIYPSSYEGFGLPLLEAQKAGCPIIAANTSSIPEVVEQSGILIDEISSTKIVEGISKLSDKDFRKEKIEQGIINAKRFTWENTFTQTIAFYKEQFLKTNT